MLIIATSWNPTLEDFLRVMGIQPNSFSAQLFEEVYDCIFISSIDLKREYNKYYSVEYPTISHFLEIHYTNEISEDEIEKKRLLLLQDAPQIIDTSYEDNLLEVVLECIRKEG